MQFKASFFLTVLALAVLALLLSLGFWQLDRAKQKQQLLDLQAARLLLDPVDLSSIDTSEISLRYLPVKTTGTLDAEHQVLIDNQVRKGQVGYSVLTPLRLNNDQAILLNRGWVAMGNDRNHLPDVKIPNIKAAFAGKLDHFPSVGIKLDMADVLSNGWPAVTQVIDVDKVGKRLGYRVMPYQLLLDKDEPYGYDREWVVMKMGPEKHHGYAFQWFALSVAWVILYFVLTLKKGFKKDEFTN
jgi:surfeit locus 1 family protein